jgi:Zn finger protein HypA/HybF involved in hydrogenase expression
MHDLHVADMILKLAMAEAEKNKLSKVAHLAIELGTVIEHGAAINPDNLKFNINMLSRGTVIEGAEVDVKEVSGASWRLVSISGD